MHGCCPEQVLDGAAEHDARGWGLHDGAGAVRFHAGDVEGNKTWAGSGMTLAALSFVAGGGVCVALIDASV